MSVKWQLRVYENQNLVYSASLDGAAELGRQNVGERPPFWKQRDRARYRVVLAPLEDQKVSRRQVLIEPVTEQSLKLTNLSSGQVVRLADGRRLDPGAAFEVSLPVVLTLGEKTVRLQGVEEEEPASDMQSLVQATIAPGNELARPDSFRSIGLAPQLGAEEVVRWLHATMGVLHSATGSMDFFAKAVRVVVDLVGLDSARILLYEGGEWRPQAVHTRVDMAQEADRPASRRVLQRVLAEKRTFWQVPAVSGAGESLASVNAVVAAPILDRKGEVIGALYGERRQRYNAGSQVPITSPEAMLVEVLACSVAAGLSRLEQEKAALRARIQFEQFFTPRLAHLLDAHPELLEGKDAEVTVLFCDLRAFSACSERLGPRKTFEWISATMNALSDCVLKEEGVLVDYIGDELIAMWGAPDQQPDHARRACRAALAMVDALGELNKTWESIIGSPMELGIGINSGTARVGNTGSAVKFKYGPLGGNVNLASRIQGATKYLRTRLLVTQATLDQLDASFLVRRLCRARVVNISASVTIYELVGPGVPGWESLKIDYENALAQFEKKEFRPAARVLGKLLSEHPYDGPCLALMARAINCLVEVSEHFDPVWELPGK